MFTVLFSTLKHELSGTKAYRQTSEKEKSVINNHTFIMPPGLLLVSMKTKRGFLHSIGYLNCTNNHLRLDLLLILAHARLPNYQKLLTSCLSTIKNHVIRYCDKVYERSSKNLFWSIKNPCEILNKLKSRGFRASSLSTYDFSTLYTSLSHNIIKDKLVDLTERTFQRKGSLYIACNDRNAFFTSDAVRNYNL